MIVLKSSIMYYWTKTPRLVQWFFPRRTWRITTTAPQLFLTFDDGPFPEITPWVLDLLAQYKARATFFCVGNQVQQYPDLYAQILAEGHAVGNHTQNHPNGWKTDTDTYVQDIQQCARFVHSSLFRPPYGKMTRRQSLRLRQLGYRSIYWDILAGDFDISRSGEDCLRGIVRHTTAGSIIALHDSPKAWDRLTYILPRLLEYFTQKGFTFLSIC